MLGAPEMSGVLEMSGTHVMPIVPGMPGMNGMPGMPGMT